MVKRHTITEIFTLHYAAVKSAQAYEAATPGTQDKRRKETAWEKAEKRFELALYNGIKE